jgi:hypothetical protein
MGSETRRSAALDARIEILRSLERSMAEKDDPDLRLLGIIRELLMEAEAARDN